MNKKNPISRSLSGIRLFVITVILALLTSCTPKVDIAAVESFNVQAKTRSGKINIHNHEEQIIQDLYTLMKSNEGIQIPLCESTRELRECIDEGFSVFVLGGTIPGLGTRKYYLFNDISLDGSDFQFIKDNSSTTFIGTPMFTKNNTCNVSVKDGGIQVDMTNYYANWAGVGNMTMAEGWAIDYIDFDSGIVGFQLDLDISGPLVIGGGSKYAILQFPKVPAKLLQSTSSYSFTH